MMETSICLIVTGGWLMPRTQAVSQGAGQRRPVNSGKLLVACNRSMASAKLARRVWSFHSGMRLPSGHPWWQNGMPQSMQRLAWRWSTLVSCSSCTSFQSRMRTGTGRLGRFSRSRWVRKPCGSAMGVLQDERPGVRAVGSSPRASASARMRSTLAYWRGVMTVNRSTHPGSASRSRATGLPVSSRCSSSSRCTSSRCSVSRSGARCRSPDEVARGLSRELSRSSTKAVPPDIPAPTLRPVGPRMSALPPVMYSSAWSPTPSTTAVAPELRTQKRSPTVPRRLTWPDVAP